MNQAVWYQPASKRSALTAFVVAIIVHLSVVAFAAFHRELPAPPFAYVPIEGLDPLPEEPETPPTLEPAPELQMPAPPDVEFVEPPPPVHRPTHVSIPSKPLQPVARGGGRVLNGNFRAFALSAPRPEYPYEARRRHLTGSGVVIVSIDPVTGNVVDAQIEQTIGDPLLDQSAARAFRRWRFKPGTPAKVRIPVTFNLAGASY